MGNRVVFGKPDIKKGDIQAVTGVLGSGWIGMGAVTESLERAFVRFTGARYAVAVSSGSGGLFLSMLASGIGKDDEVITSPMTFPATANEIIHTGARVRFVDVDSTGNIDAFAPVGCAKCVGCILNNHQSMLACQSHDSAHVARPSMQMDG